MTKKLARHFFVTNVLVVKETLVSYFRGEAVRPAGNGPQESTSIWETAKAGGLFSAAISTSLTRRVSRKPTMLRACIYLDGRIKKSHSMSLHRHAMTLT